MFPLFADSSETFLAKWFKIPALKRTPLRPLERSADTVLPPDLAGLGTHAATSTTPRVNVYNDRNKKRGRRRGRKLSCRRQIKHGNKRSPVDLSRRTPPKKIDNRQTPPKKIVHSAPAKKVLRAC